MILSFKSQFKQPILDGTKIHSIREDPHNRWRPGMKIHAATGVRTKNYQCFSLLKCVSVQPIVLSKGLGFRDARVNGNHIDPYQLSENDGFEFVGDFFEWFFPNGEGVFKGKIIHWTDFQY